MTRAFLFLLSAALLVGCPGSKTEDAKTDSKTEAAKTGKTAPAQKTAKPKKAKPPEPKGTTKESAAFAVYLPPNAGKEKRPLLIAFEPQANWRVMIRRWGPVADELGWIILASKVVKEGMDMAKVCSGYTKILRVVTKDYPIDPKRVVTTGVAAAGMLSHFFAMVEEDTIRAVIPVASMVHEKYREEENYPKGKICAFLASPSDKRFKDMQADRKRLEGLGWKVSWTEFEGGSVLPPHAKCLEAAKFVDESWK
jgi:hypothetical protein